MNSLKIVEALSRPSKSDSDDPVAAALSGKVSGSIDQIERHITALEAKESRREQQPRRPVTELSLALQEAARQVSEAREQRRQTNREPRSVPESHPSRRSPTERQTISLSEAIAARPNATSPAELPSEFERQVEAERAGRLDAYISERRKLIVF